MYILMVSIIMMVLLLCSCCLGYRKQSTDVKYCTRLDTIVFVLWINILSYIYRFIFTNGSYHHINTMSIIHSVSTNHMIFERVHSYYFNSYKYDNKLEILIDILNMISIKTKANNIYHYDEYKQIVIFHK